MSKSFLSCDWGTSSFRLRLIDAGSGAVTGESLSDEGIGWANDAFVKQFSAEEQRVPFYYSIINRHIENIKERGNQFDDNIPVIVSGMASSNMGILELPYTLMPFSTGGEDIGVQRVAKANGFTHDLNVISGARTATDVMRGEETQLIGCANGHVEAKQLFIFPGTHSKHIITVNGKATDLKTYMTGELFSLLTLNSILSDSVATGKGTIDTENEKAFEEGVRTGHSGNLSHALFIVRTNHLLKRFSKTANFHYLSGLLIGSELGDLAMIDTAAITIAGEAQLMNRYVKACRIIGVVAPIETVDAATATIRGQLVIYRRLYQ